MLWLGTNTNYYNFIEGLPGQQLSDEVAVSESPLFQVVRLSC